MEQQPRDVTVAGDIVDVIGNDVKHIAAVQKSVCLFGWQYDRIFRNINRDVLIRETTGNVLWTYLALIDVLFIGIDFALEKFPICIQCC